MIGEPVFRIGLLRLTDTVPLIIARELGCFAGENVDVALSLEPSWANIADKLPGACLTARCCCRRWRSRWSWG